MESSPKMLQMIDTKLYADSAEWCPFQGMQDVLLCGTYQLLESEQSPGQPQVRIGQLQVFQLHTPEKSSPSLTQSHCMDMPGVLDIKWARSSLNSAAVCGLVNAKGEFQLWKMGEESTERATYEKVSPEHLANTEIAQCIVLSLDWAAHSEGCVPRVVTSDSTGGLTVLEVGSTIMATSQWHAHDYEAWICAFDQWNTNIIYSGSDDCKLKIWDLRVGTTPVSTNSRFTAGVCSIQSSPQREHLLAVGGYDENLQIFDTRQMRRALSTAALGGGVWRVKWDPFSARYILTATMYNGYHIVDCSKTDDECLPVVAHYTHKQTSLAYGVDWCRMKTTYNINSQKAILSAEAPSETHDSDATTQALLASCSFYDHSLQLWQWCD